MYFIDNCEIREILISVSKRSMKHKLLYMNFDGFADYYWKGHEDRFPNITALACDSICFSSCYSCIPSITVPMQTAIVTGAKSGITGNCWQYFDRKLGKTVQTGRFNRAETIAELYGRLGLRVLSIQQFAVENHGCSRDDFDHLYVQPEKSYSERFDVLIDYIRTREIGDKSFSELHDAILFYIDDLDTDGHNHHEPFVATEDERVEKVRRKLELIDGRVGELITAMKETGIWDSTTILLTADHGMVGFDLPSALPWLSAKVSELTGMRCTYLEDKIDESDIFITSNTIQAQVFFLKNFPDQNDLKRKLLLEDRIETVMTTSELNAAEVDEMYADMLISPTEGTAFFMPMELPEGIRFASHDSLNEKAQHVFALIKHPGTASRVVSKRVEITDLMPVVLKLMGMPDLRDHHGEIVL